MDGVIDILLRREIDAEPDPKVRAGLERALEIVQTSGYYNLEDLENEDVESNENLDFSEFWRTDVSTLSDIKDEIANAAAAGTWYDDVYDYLDTLLDMDIIDVSEFNNIIDWANRSFDLS